MAIYEKNGNHHSNDPVLELFHNARDNPITVVCTKDNPPMIGFGEKLKVGDVVEINGTIHNELGFCISVPGQCAFYRYDYFSPQGGDDVDRTKRKTGYGYL